MKEISVRELSSLATKTYKDGKIWSDAFIRALNGYEKITVPSGKYYIDKTLVVSSDTRIFAEDNAEIILIKGVKTLLLRNENVIDGSDKPISKNSVKDENISIIGGIWCDENDERLGYGESGCFDENNSMVGVSTCFLFSNVKNIIIRDLSVRRHEKIDNLAFQYHVSRRAMPTKNNTNPTKTPLFPCLLVNSRLKYGKYICVRPYQNSPKISAFWLSASIVLRF